jgi:hypothetical protein
MRSPCSAVSGWATSMRASSARRKAPAKPTSSSAWSPSPGRSSSIGATISRRVPIFVASFGSGPWPACLARRSSPANVSVTTAVLVGEGHPARKAAMSAGRPAVPAAPGAPVGAIGAACVVRLGVEGEDVRRSLCGRQRAVGLGDRAVHGSVEPGTHDGRRCAERCVGSAGVDRRKAARGARIVRVAHCGEQGRGLAHRATATPAGSAKVTTRRLAVWSCRPGARRKSTRGERWRAPHWRAGLPQSLSLALSLAQPCLRFKALGAGARALQSDTS